MVNFPPPYEDLLPELQDCFEDDGVMPMIRHPLVYSVPHHFMMNAYMNKSLKAKQGLAETFKNEERWTAYIFLHERPYRLMALTTLIGRKGFTLGSLKFLQAVRDVWVDTEFPSQNALAWNSVFGHAIRANFNPLGMRFTMTSGEQKWFDEAPEILTIYRGFAQEENPHGELTDDGMSWTVDYEKAKWFARRFVKQNLNEDGTLKASARHSKIEIPYVAHATIPKKDIIAYIEERGESEVIIFSQFSINVQGNHDNVKYRNDGFKLSQIEEV
tara:strand:- start:1767 stop:2582 length:816 start_codon:yes stop_codon:yes gene_type:complete